MNKYPVVSEAEAILQAATVVPKWLISWIDCLYFRRKLNGKNSIILLNKKIAVFTLPKPTAAVYIKKWYNCSCGVNRLDSER